MPKITRLYHCEICEKGFKRGLLYPIEIIRESILNALLEEHSNLNLNGFICQNDYQKYRKISLENLIKEEIGEITELEEEVLESIKNQDLLAVNINEDYAKNLSLGERFADKISSFGGSWKFICIFFLFIVGWMILNTFLLLNNQYDPYPYILLNLILSCLAAIQAPIIMMSQNRHADYDRVQAENDYKINLKAEVQIRQLNLKLDQFMNSQWHRLVEVQKLQTELMHDINEIVNKPRKK